MRQTMMTQTMMTATESPESDIAVPITAAELSLLHLDPSVGAGNFAFKALAVSRDPEQPILHSLDSQTLAKGLEVDSLSLTQLTVHAEQWAHWYRSNDVGEHDVVGVYAREGLHQILHLCALTMLGAVAAITSGAMPGDVASAHFRHLRVKGVVCSVEQQAALDDDFGADLAFCADIETVSLLRKHDPVVPFRHSDVDPIMITHSSGTTGRPKPVTLAHGQWFHGIRDNIARQAGRTGERRVLVLPASHNSALAFIIHSVLDGGQALLVSTQSGDAAADAIESFRPQSVAAFPVTHVNLALKHAGQRDFSSVNYWISSGDASHQKHIRRLVAQGCTVRADQTTEGSVFVDGLGSSELGHTSFLIQHTMHSRHYDRCVGRPHRWVDARVFDAAGRPAPDGTIGRLGVSSPSITPGYWNDSELTARSKIDGYFLTGDLAYRDSTGRFFHVDRTGDVINTAGGPCYSLLSEEYLMTLDEIVDDCIVSAVPAGNGVQRPVAIVWSERDAQIIADPLIENFNEALAARDMPLMHGVAVVSPDAIPRGITGKVLKCELLSALADVADDPTQADWIIDYCVADAA